MSDPATGDMSSEDQRRRDLPDPGRDGPGTGGPEKGTVEVEDLDVLDKRRKKAREAMTLRDRLGLGDSPESKMYRRLVGYVRPYRTVLVMTVFMAMLAGMTSAAAVLLLEQVLSPIVDRPVPSSGLSILRDLAGPLLDLAGAEGLLAALAAAARATAATVGVHWDSHPPETQLGLAILMFFGLTVFTEANNYLRRLTTRTVSLDLVRQLRFAVFDRLMDLSVRFFQKNPSGRLLSRVTNDLNNLGGVLVDVMVIYVPDFFKIFWMLVVLWIKAGWLTVAALFIGVLALVPAQRVARKIRRREHDNQKKMGSVYQAVQEVLQAQKIVKAFGAEEHERERFSVINDDFTRNRKRIASLRARTGPMMEVVGGLGIGLLLWLGGRHVLSGGMAGSTFMAVIFLIIAIIGSVRRLGETSTKIQAGFASADRVTTVLNSEPEIFDHDGAVELDGIREGIAFHDVDYSYDPQTRVLHGIDLKVPVGSSVAIVGPTGSGKSTIADLVPRFFDPESGRVTIDGRDVRDYTVESLRRHIAIVTQDTILFRDSLANNIAYARPGTSREDIIRAAKAAHCDEFISAMPEGYDTVVGERGLTLSGGERQRVAIARALLRDAPILILDEATSALDSQAEEIVQEAIDRLKEGRTTITIAHRLSTIRDSDNIVVIDRGAIAEQGAHDELLARGGLYSRLHKMQSGGGLERARRAAGGEV